MDIGKLKWAEEVKDLTTSNYDILFHISPYDIQNCLAYGEFTVQVSDTTTCIQKIEFTKQFDCSKVFSYCFASLKNKSHILELVFC
jgi:hypothetical protein